MNSTGYFFAVCSLRRFLFALICMVLVAAGLPPGAARADFPIATGSAAIGFAFDGTNYLVGIEDHTTSPPAIGGQRIDKDGNKVGSVISTGRNGISAYAAFDGANYLLVWEDDPGGTGPGRFRIYGQFISPSGTKVGDAFPLSDSGINYDGVKTMAFGGGKYLVTYTRLIDPAQGDDSTNRYIAGRVVDPDGSMGSEFRISTGYGKASDVAFDGTNFFVVWCEDQYDYEIRGRFVSPAGVPGTEISVNAGPGYSDNPKSVAFDGANYLVVWNEQAVNNDESTWDVYAQRVSTSGALVGGVITVTSEGGPQMVTTVAFDGVNYFATWVDMSSAWNLYGQYIGKDGALAGGKTTVKTDATNKIGGVGFAGGKYLALVNKGVVMGEDGISSVTGVDGNFFPPMTHPTDAPTISSLSTGSGVPGSAVTITGANFLSGATTVTFNGILSTNVTVTDANHLTAYVPEGATSGTISITTSGGSVTSSAGFSVLATLTVNLAGTGSGTVTATDGISLSCASPSTSCTGSAPYGTSVTLAATPSLGSTFGGWSGACTGTPCTFPLNGDRAVTAAFALQQNLRIGSGYYGTLKSAFANAANNDVILARNLTLPDLANDATFDKAGVTATLRGGYTDAAFSTRTATDFTSVAAPLTIVNGTLVLDQVTVL